MLHPLVGVVRASQCFPSPRARVRLANAVTPWRNRGEDGEDHLHEEETGRSPQPRDGRRRRRRHDFRHEVDELISLHRWVLQEGITLDLGKSLGILACAESERDKLLLVEDEARGRERVRPSVRSLRSERGLGLKEGAA